MDISNEMKVLVIDDEKGTRDMLYYELQAEGYEVTTAEDGYKALEMIKGTLYNIVMVDLKMPGLNGLQILQKIKEHNPETEVIIVTGYGSFESAIQAMNEGAFTYIQKPLDMDSVFAILKKAVEKQRLVLENKKLLADLQKANETLEQKIKERTQELQDAYDELKSAQEQLIQSEKMTSLGIMSSGVAHELNNPLTSVLLIADILLYEMPPDNPWKKDLQEIKKSALRCKDIINNLLGFARHQEFHIQTTDVNEVIENTLSLAQYQINAARVEIVKKYEKNLPPVEMSVSHIEQVFLNIILNAIDAMPSGGTLTITTSTRVITEKFRRATDIFKQGQQVVSVSFSDTGKGITRENLIKIFDPFFTTKEPGKGTGLGLSVVYGIVQRHKGTIKAESDGEGKGATFTITLPLSQKGS